MIASCSRISMVIIICFGNLMRSITLLSLILTSRLKLGHSAIPQFTCPTLGSTPVKIPLPVFNSSRTFYLVKSQSDSLCTLNCLTPLKPKAALVDMDSWDTIPIARSYLNNDWEPTAGPYAAKQILRSCNANRCKLVIPSLPTTDPNAILLLMSYSYSIDTRSEAARFLEQATFGPTRESVAQLGEDLANTMPNWIKNQMDPNIVPPSFHRETYRRQVGSAMKRMRASRIAAPKHPCEPNSRWRLHSFTMYDRGATNVKISIIPNDGRYLISINGIPRTAVRGLQFRIREAISGEYINVDAQEGEYSLCWAIEERVGGYLNIQPADLISDNCFHIVGGNPALELPDDILNNYSDVIPRLLLPPINEFIELKPILYGYIDADFFGGAGRMYNDSLYEYSGQEQCDKLPHGDFENLLGLFASGELAYYDGRLELDGNTLESPNPDGGGKKTLAGTFCSNAPKNDFNLESCILSHESTACAHFQENPRFILSSDVVRIFYQLTGRYVYAIRNLQMTTVPSPCTPYVRHRWVKIIDNDCYTSGVDEVTNDTLIWLMIQYKDLDSNDLLVDIRLDWIGDYGRTCSSAKTVGMKLFVDGVCYHHVHPDEYNVYDLTYWTLPDTHPGNAVASGSGHQNPIKKWAMNNQTELFFPSWHTMDRWNNNKESFDFVGRLGNGYKLFDLPSKLRSSSVIDVIGVGASNSGGTAVVCGSPGEVANDPMKSHLDFSDQSQRNVNDLGNQKKNMWNSISLWSNDQLRQRMAWALSQILVISPNQIGSKWLTEAYANYYDIFVRHAFGNYRDILKEVAYSPLMAEMLSFLESKSTAFVLRSTGDELRPDENFAREVMQLFTIGVNQLNNDGTSKVDPSSGFPIPTYQNHDVQSFARAWTGFYRQERRSNIELGGDEDVNRIDPMRINPEWRDVFPKMDLNGGFIGDSYTLCSDLPEKQFLKKGAKYILLGSHNAPEFQSGDMGWWDNWSDDLILRIELDPSSQLRKFLCNYNAFSGSCDFKSVVVLDENLSCTGLECASDNLRAFKVQNDPPVFYEYIRPACVELTFYNTGKKISRTWPKESMCANVHVEEFMDVCCPPWDVNSGRGQNLCHFTGERVKYGTGASRCSVVYGAKAGPCDWKSLLNDGNNNNPYCLQYMIDYNWYWTNMTCTIRVKVRADGNVAMIHFPDLSINKNLDDKFVVRDEFSLNNTNYFSIKWEKDSFPSPINNCGNGVCAMHGLGCLCDVTVVEKRVYNVTPATAAQVLGSLFIGSLKPDAYSSGYTVGSSSAEVQVYHRNGGTPFDKTTIFSINVKGKTLYFKNIQSMVEIRDFSGKRRFQFRNPPHFMSFVIPDIRDASYETDSVLDHYFYHDNLAPFLAARIIQRFGISNPSPRYVQQVARAFTDGYYMNMGSFFGDHKYGSLSALLAATLLDREARSVVLDKDPSFGSVREPMIKLIAFLRALDFYPTPGVKEVTFENLHRSIGQMPYSIPNVFSFFLPDFSSSKIKAASLVSPESQVLTTPTIVGFINGIFSLVELGLTKCFGGFGEFTTWWCLGLHNDPTNINYSRGFLGYLEAGYTPTDVVDELAMLLTCGRLSKASRRLIQDSSDLKTAVKLIVTTPEYHCTGATSPMKIRPSINFPQPSGTPYKAVIFVNLEGGMDSFNVLVPHSGCAGTNYLYNQYAAIRNELALSQSDILQIDASTSSQPCKTFGIHPNLEFLQQLYNDGDLAFLANIGVLQQYVNKENWWQKTTRTSLFAHNTQQDEVNFVDIFDIQAGKGVLGRMIDVLVKKGMKSGSISASGIANALVSKLSPIFVMDPNNYEKINPIPWADDILGQIKLLNNANKIGSSYFGDTWSKLLTQSLGENKLLYDAITSTGLNTVFSDTWLSQELEVVAKMIKTKDVRGSERDMFYVDMGGFDTHSDMMAVLGNRMAEINDALTSFVSEMKSQGRWDDVVVVFVSEFARTLTPNTSRGSDHAWGGNYFYAGGSVTGKRILGKYPSDLTSNSQYRLDPGIVIPTTSWDEFWVLVAQWYGITSDDDLIQVLPNLKSFAGLGTSL